MGSVWRGARSVVDVVSLIIRATEVSRDFGRYQEGRKMVYHLVLVAGAWPTLDTENLFVFVVRSSLSRPRREGGAKKSRPSFAPLKRINHDATLSLLERNRAKER